MKFLIIISVIVMLFFTTMFSLGNWLAYDQMSQCDSVSKEDTFCNKADVVVAISGGDTEARAIKAIDLYKKGFAKYIIFAGAAADPESPSNAAVMQKIAIKKGVSEKVIIIEEDSRNTTENAENVANILHENNWTNVILVTENYHLRRAFTAFVNADAKSTFRATAAKDQSFWWITPRGWFMIISELGGMSKAAAGGNSL